MRYKGEISIEIYDQSTGRPEPAVTATVHIDIGELDDPLQSLTVAALEQALDVARIATKYSGGRT